MTGNITFSVLFIPVIHILNNFPKLITSESIDLTGVIFVDREPKNQSVGSHRPVQFAEWNFARPSPPDDSCTIK